MSFRTQSAALFWAVALLSGCSFELVGMSDAVWSADDSTPTSDVVADVAYSDVATPDLKPYDAADSAPQDTLTDQVTADVDPADCHQDSDCDDEVDCTLDTCQSGYCNHTPDDMACPEMEGCFTYYCDASQGCLQVARAGEPCVSDDKCVQSATCDETGACLPEVRVICKEGPCMNSKCQPETGECTYTVLDGGECDDANPCTVGDLCVAGNCVGEVKEAACPCQTDSDCLPFGTGDLCSGKLVCAAGHCTVDEGTVVVCPEAPPNACFKWQCEAQTADCIKVFLALGTLCSDGNSCTKSDHCDAGICVGTSLADTTPCNLDSDACTQDQCQQGQCTAGPDKICSAVGQCLFAECDTQSGKCVSQPLTGVECDDQDECTSGESCIWGECSGGVFTCVDCSSAEMNGRPCNDGVPETVGDLCYRGLCRGFLASDSSSDLGLVTALAAEADLVHLLASGSAAAGGDSAYGFWEFLWDGMLSTWVGLGTDLLLDASGPVAVGKPGLVYYRGMSWTANNALRASLANACPGFGVESKPMTVATVEAAAVSVLNLTGPVVVVGFEATGAAISSGCVLASCYQTLLGGNWVCGRIPVAFGNSAETEGVKVRITALDGAVGDICGVDGGLCAAGVRVVAGYELSKPGASEWGLVESVLGGLASNWETKSLFSDATSVGSGQNMGPVLAVQVRGDGALVAGGTQGWLYSRTAGQSSGSVKVLPSDLAAAGPNIVGIVLDDMTSVVLINLIPKLGSVGENPQVLAGILAGEADWPFLSDLQGQVHLTLLRSFATCSTCTGVADSELGVRDVVSLLGESDGVWGEGGRLVVGDSWRQGSELLGEILFLQP